eukprot:gene22331-30576_t
MTTTANTDESSDGLLKQALQKLDTGLQSCETLPPEILPSEKLETNISMSPQEISVKRSIKLAAAACKELDDGGLRSWVSQHENAVEVSGKEESRFRNKALDCKKLLTTYDSLSDDSGRLDFLMYTPLGLYAFSRLAYTAAYHKGYTPEMELDLAGTAFFVLGYYRKDCAEIKSGERDEAIDQTKTPPYIVLLPVTAVEIAESVERCALRISPELVTVAIRQP